MARLKDQIVPAAASTLGYVYLRFLRATMRLDFRGREELRDIRERRGPYLMALWHSRFPMMVFIHPGPKLTSLSSSHRDSRMLTSILGKFGVRIAYGSSTKGGARGLREVVRCIREGYDVSFTPDGPKGPRRRVKAGLVVAAKLSGVPIVPVSFAARPAWIFGSWDRTQLPKPFSRGVFVCGEPIDVPRDADDDEQERIRLHVERAMDRLTDEVDRELGLEPEAPREPVA